MRRSSLLEAYDLARPVRGDFGTTPPARIDVALESGGTLVVTGGGETYSSVDSEDPPLNLEGSDLHQLLRRISKGRQVMRRTQQAPQPEAAIAVSCRRHMTARCAPHRQAVTDWLLEEVGAMPREAHRLRRSPSTPPKEGILSNVLGEFLDPIDALFTIFFSILFALLFTLSYAVLIYYGALGPSLSSNYGQELFLAILGAVAAWGIIDGVLYALGEVLARRERYRLLHYVQTSETEEEAATAVAWELDFILEPITSDEQRRALYHDMLTYLRQAEPQATGLRRDDVVGAVATTLLAVLAVLPSLLPLLLLDNLTLAIHVSNVVSIVVVFATGYSWGNHTGTSPWKMGMLLASVCLAMVLIATLLGG